MANTGWICPFCNTAATIQESDRHSGADNLLINNKHGQMQLTYTFIVCPNPQCKEFTLSATMRKAVVTSPLVTSPTSEFYKQWKLIPESTAKIFPDYIPAPILEDYREACLIRELSPKASATLARRCLQGIIRDFWGVKKGKLSQEIDAIKDKLDPLTWEAIDTVRSVGNIGAHMEKDINIIIDVEPNEAGLLLELIETVLRDWYITRHDRKERLKAVIELGKNKKEAKNVAAARKTDKE